tara:strand:- start:165 stop:788 length:624 start_codon:yes stop_codon:yes gene_type:complete
MKNILPKVCILDYGSGNVNSVYNILNYMKYSVKISNNEEEIKNSSHIILPGVGSFGSAIDKINKLLPINILSKEVLEKRKPFLGICVGMQVLATKGFENGEHKGLGWIDGVVRKIDSKNHSLPHIGWQGINVKIKEPITLNISNLDFYFVHSYAMYPENANYLAATTNYGEEFCSIVKKENIYGTQFHPEKSQQAGMQVIKNFIELK